MKKQLSIFCTFFFLNTTIAKESSCAALCKNGLEKTTQEELVCKNSSVEEITNYKKCLDIKKNSAPKQSPQRTVIVTNNITEEMRAYSYWGVKFKPKIKVSINGTEVSPSREEKIITTSNTIKVRYDYDFNQPHPRAKGSFEYEMSVPQEGDSFAVTFDWKKEENERIMLNRSDIKK
jgi:hypothetical protein